MKKAHLDLIQYYLEPVLAHSPDYISAQVKFTQQKLRDMDFREIVTVLGKWKEIEEDRFRSGSKARLKVEKEKKLREMIGQQGRVIEMSDILDSWVRNFLSSFRRICRKMRESREGMFENCSLKKGAIHLYILTIFLLHDDRNLGYSLNCNFGSVHAHIFLHT